MITNYIDDMFNQLIYDEIPIELLNCAIERLISEGIERKSMILKTSIDKGYSKYQGISIQVDKQLKKNTWYVIVK